MLVMPMALTIYRFGFLSCKPNALGTHSLYCNKPHRAAPAAVSGAGNGVHGLGITRSNWSMAAASCQETTAVAGGRRQKDDVLTDQAEDWRSYLAPEMLEVLRQLEPWVEEHVLPLLKPVEASWQPSDLLLDPAALGSDGFHAACLELRAAAAGVPDDLLVSLVGNMVTEEALPTYQSMLNRVEAVRDATGTDATSWAHWIRGWSAEENRHGDVLNRYMYLSGRFDMCEVERTVQRLICDGMAVPAHASPFHGFVYVAFQERATAIAHGNMAHLVGGHGAGDTTLARICGTVADDEKRHETAYTRIMGKLFEADPDAAVRAMAYMMWRRIYMPTAFINDGHHSSGDFYARIIAIGRQAGMYTVSDYRGILEHLLWEWGVQELGTGLSGEGRRAQEYLCSLPNKIQRLEEMAHDSMVRAQNKPTTHVPISWIFDRTISVIQP